MVKRCIAITIFIVTILGYITYNNFHEKELKQRDKSIYTEKEVLEKLNLTDQYYRDNKILEGYTIPSNLAIKCKYTESSILVTTSDISKVKNQFTSPEGIYEYNLKTEELKLISRKMQKDRYIKDVQYDNGYIVWEEDEDQVIGEDNSGKRWSIYLMNISTGEVITVDESSEKNSKGQISYYRYNPSRVTINGDNIVYKICETNKNDEIIQIVKLYNIKTKELEVIRESENIEDNIFSEPAIDGDKIVFCRRSNVYRSTENRFSEIFVYCISSKKFEIIFQTETNKYYFDADINGDRIAIVKMIPVDYEGQEYFTSEIGIYDIKERKYEVIKDDAILPSQEYVKFKGIPITLTLTSFSENYLTFINGNTSSTVIYDRKNRKYIDLLNEKDKEGYLTRDVGIAFDNLITMYLWRNEYSRTRIYILEK